MGREFDEPNIHAVTLLGQDLLMAAEAAQPVGGGQAEGAASAAAQQLRETRNRLLYSMGNVVQGTSAPSEYLKLEVARWLIKMRHAASCATEDLDYLVDLSTAGEYRYVRKAVIISYVDDL